jgi:hypothetical protein
MFNNRFYVFILFIVVSCTKPEDSDLWTEVNVTATDYVTGEPLTDIYISILERKETGFFDSEVSVINEEFTDANGNYKFGWKARKNSKYDYEYVAQANASKYYIVDFLQFAYLQKGNVYNYNVSLAPKGFLRLNYKNINCFDENDEMFLYYINALDVPNNNTSANPDIDTHYGCNIDIVTSYNPEPIGRYEYYYHVKRNGNTTYFLDTITISEGQEAEIKVYY